jgi:hypothetical protein
LSFIHSGAWISLTAALHSGAFFGFTFLVVILKGVGNFRKATGLLVNYGEQLCGV